MIIRIYFIILSIVCCFWAPLIVLAAGEEKITLTELVEKIIRYYPTIDVAAIQIQRARQEFAKVESQLGWVLTAKGGYSRDVSFIDSPTDHYEVGVGLNKKLESGSSIEMSGLYTYDDSKVNFSSVTPNPANRTRIDIKYRIPFAKGNKNPTYTTSLLSAKSQLAIQNANQRLVIDNLIQQSMLLYYDALLTHVKINDANNSVKRSRRLLEFVNKNLRLGLSERKDILRVQSQLKRQIAQRDSLLVVWSQQRSELNKLIGNPPMMEIEPVLQDEIAFDLKNTKQLLNNILEVNPGLNLQKGQMQTIEAEISIARDAKRNQLDLVLSIGTRTSSGDTATGSTSSEETAGGAQLEYRYDMDKRGFSATLYQSLLKKEQTQKEIERISYELKYRIESLLAQYNANLKAVKSNLEHYMIEKQKIEDAYKRYKEGRSTTNELIDYEDAMQASHLSLQNQKVALSRNLSNIALLTGKLWRDSVIDEKINNMAKDRIGE